MRTALLVVALAAGPAHADGTYYTEGLGATTVHDELASHESDTTLARFNLGVGHRFGPWSIEAGMVANISGEIFDQSADLTALEVNLKYAQPISKHLELYVRGSAGYGWADQALADFSGRSLGFGAGIQLKGKGSVTGLLFWPLFFLINQGPMMTAALYVDDGYDFYRLHDSTGEKAAVDAQLTHISMGVAVGTDF